MSIFNPVLSSVQEDVADLNNDVSGLKRDVISIQHDISTHEIGTVAEQINAIAIYLGVEFIKEPTTARTRYFEIPFSDTIVSARKIEKKG